MPLSDRRLLLVLIGLSLAAGATHVVAAVVGAGGLRQATMWCVMSPLIAAALVLRVQRRAGGVWMLAGMAFGFGGDVLGGGGFLMLLGLFLVGHLCYLAAFWRFRSASLAGRPGMVGYLLVLVVGLAFLVPAAGSLAAPVVAYGAVLTAVAVLATAAGRIGVLAGALFLVSDLLLGVSRLVVSWPSAFTAAVVMATYVPAQVLLLLSYARLAAGSPKPVTGAVAGAERL